ncbi:MAG: ABC transporter substrate-binding protein [Deltaproteobacteria bacterium]|nr:ABC transporter substrate-binding protein [Deltaproteobacteria bacterium]
MNNIRKAEGRLPFRSSTNHNGGSMFARFSLAGLLSLCLMFVSTVSGQAGEGGGVLRVGGPWWPKTLDIQKSGYVFKRLGVVDNIVEVDEGIRIVPGLAESWTVSPDKMTWSFSIRDGVLFHDGTPLTAGILKENLDRLARVGTLLKDVPLASVQAPDDRTLVLTTTEPFAPLPAYLTMGETGALAPSSFDESGEVVRPVGTGPFVFESWKVKEEVTLTRNDRYWGDKAHVDTVVFRAVPDAVTRLAMLKAGEIDIAQILPPQAIASLESSGKYDILRMPIGRCRMACFNLNKEPFSDHRVREAVNLAVNRADLVKYVLEGVGESAITLYPPQIYWANTTLPAFQHDPDRAAALLSEAGWIDKDGGRIRKKNGEPLKIKLVTYTERAALPPTAEIMQAQLAAVGFDVEIVATQLDAAEAMRFKGDFDMYLMGRGLLFVPDPDYVLMTDYFSSNTEKQGWGAYHYENPEVDALILAGRSEFDQAARKRIYDRVQAILLKDQPMVYLNYYVNVDAVAKKVRGYRMHPTESSYHLETVSLSR